ncbi:MAG: JDVT-CTERM domain-containing protein, partial [Gammaproteobacteria bacterium]|nr:JDVT-CTERM domain-containing protein [Gammaproteobacteria bacterium]
MSVLSRFRFIPGALFYSFFLMLVLSASHSQAAFDAAPTGEIATPGSKSWGGVSWGDFNNDQCLDALVNTDKGVYLYQQDSVGLAQCVGEFSLARIFTLPRIGLRSVIWGDMDNDGFIDFAVNRNNNIAIYKNGNGTAAGFSVIMDFNPGNSEGMSWIDYNADGYLDLLIENNERGPSLPDEEARGLRIYKNSQGRFKADDFVSIAGSASKNGDYITATDFDVDGDVDFYVRRHGDNTTPSEADLFVNDGNGNFTADYEINEIALNSDKGGAVFCDFDNDGDFDLVRTNSGQLGVFEQTGVGRGQFQLNKTTEFTGDFSSVACGDVDNDGHVDLFFSAGESGSNALYLNQGGFAFTQNNMNISASGVGRGAAFADFDNDGDLDLLINKDKVASELWENKNESKDYLQVQLTTLGRDAIGASVRLYTCTGTALSGRQEINGGMGRGSQSAPLAHFGLGDNDQNQAYVVTAQFVGGDKVRRTLVPSALNGNRRVLIDSQDESNDAIQCADTDGDGVVDIIDEDDDNDGVPDGEDAFPLIPGEGGTGDDVDSDNDGVSDDEDAFPLDPEESRDSDGDGIGDNRDEDDDNDGLTDLVEGSGERDTDGDGVADSLDTDSDNDGISDLLEADPGNVVDADNNGRIDEVEDQDGNGLDDRLAEGNAPVDTDGDGVADFRDLDSDNDAILDNIERGEAEDGQPVDSDGDAVPNYRDLDSDNDGIPDIREGGGIDDNSQFQFPLPILDENSDGLNDSIAATPPAVPDTDGNGIKDYIDLDADGDGRSDVIEAGGRDSNNDRILDDIIDVNNNGYKDNLESNPLPIPDTDGDGIADFQDPDNVGVAGAPGVPGSPSNAPLKTGLDGVGGCTVNPDARFDPLLPLMLVILMLHSLWRRFKKSSSVMAVVLAIFVCGSLMPVTVIAENTMKKQWYGGVGAGISEMNPDTADTGFDVDDDNDAGWKLFAGYDWSDAISIEAYYSDLGEVTLSPSGALEYQDFGIGGLYYLFKDVAGQEGFHLFAKA